MPQQIDMNIDGRPDIGHLYTPGGGDIAECKAVGPTHVVVAWLRCRAHRPVIYTREEFAREFQATTPEHIEQPDLFAHG